MQREAGIPAVEGLKTLLGYLKDAGEPGIELFQRLGDR